MGANGGDANLAHCPMSLSDREIVQELLRDVSGVRHPATSDRVLPEALQRVTGMVRRRYGEGSGWDKDVAKLTIRFQMLRVNIQTGAERYYYSHDVNEFISQRRAAIGV